MTDQIALELLDPHDMGLVNLLLSLGEIALLVGEESEAVATYERALI